MGGDIDLPYLIAFISTFLVTIITTIVVINFNRIRADSRYESLRISREEQIDRLKSIIQTRYMTPNEVRDIKTKFEMESRMGRSIVLPEGFQLVPIPAPYQIPEEWPIYEVMR